MKSVKIFQYGGPEVMRMVDEGVRMPGAGEVRVIVRAAAINPLDWKQRRGDMKLFMGKKFPKGVGSDFSGVVDAIGPAVDDFQVGDEVFGTMDVKTPGSFAEVLVVNSRFLAKKPSRLSFAEAACLPIPAMTAWAALVTKAKLFNGARILINGCTGAVGMTAVQLALTKGARITGTCGSSSIARAKAAGVTQIIDYTTPTAWSNIEKFDAIFDTAGTFDVRRGLSLLKPGGTFVDINPTAKRFISGLLTSRYKLAFANMATHQLAHIAELAAQGALHPHVGLQCSFSEAIDALAAVEKGVGVRVGRTVLVF